MLRKSFLRTGTSYLLVEVFGLPGVAMGSFEEFTSRALFLEYLHPSPPKD
jgi:hypothetical protein